jgi:hypothetical protein
VRDRAVGFESRPQKAIRFLRSGIRMTNYYAHAAQRAVHWPLTRSYLYSFLNFLNFISLRSSQRLHELVETFSTVIIFRF